MRTFKKLFFERVSFQKKEVIAAYSAGYVGIYSDLIYNDCCSKKVIPAAVLKVFNGVGFQ